MSDSMEEVLRALGRVEGALEAGNRHREELGRNLENVRTNIHHLRNDVQIHLNTTNDHERRISALELLPPLITQMANHGERLKEIEDKIEEHEFLIREARGVTKALRWIWAGVLVAAGMAAWITDYLIDTLAKGL